MAGATHPGTQTQINVPILNEDNHKEWKDAILLQLRLLELDYAVLNEEPPEVTEESTGEAKQLRSQWEKSNGLCVLFIKSRISRKIRFCFEDIKKAKPLLKAIDDNFIESKKVLAMTLIMKLRNLRLSTVKGTRKHIMELRDIAAQLKKLKIILPDAFVVHFALNTLSQEYSAFKIAYNTHKDEWSINQLITMCTQEETRLVTELGESAFMATTRPKRKSGKPKGLTIAAKEKLTPKADIKKIQKCFFCKKKGHMKKDCIKFQKWMSQKGYDKTETAKGN
ncbi:PREDICTED: uncharacterized protein LOC109162689 [Ipomoea nil]|uniref:uncharacterized protein LOC109162688 n=1 Tax=Ipomoea nil TaxID=35883 RepID=UPI0009016525|nr:PREDICTED: uncharacterized protein LOC109162688 [Ipomoea nil]XP_019166919.1 PREDICTED: uncharacterized protein LOC109162689 [Ipomoea nil]